jgi:hypothetical protein
LEGGVQGELQQQVFGRRQHAQLTAPRAPPRPQALTVERVEPRRRDDTSVQLEDPVPGGVAERPGVIAARHLGKSRLGERGYAFGEALERDEVHVRHRAVGFDAAHRLGEDDSRERQRPDPTRLQQCESTRREAHLPQRAHEQRAALGHERGQDGFGPDGPLALERPQQQGREPLLSARREHRLGAEAQRQRRQRSTHHELAHEAPRL